MSYGIPPQYADPLLDPYYVEGAPEPNEIKSARPGRAHRARSSKPFRGMLFGSDFLNLLIF